MNTFCFYLTLCTSLFFSFIPQSYAEAEAKDPYKILTDHFKAIGGLQRIKSINTRQSIGKIRHDGLHGTFQLWQKRPLQSRIEKNYSIIKYIEGDSGTQSWLFDTNGQVLIGKDHKTLERRQIALLMDNFEHLDPHSRNFSLVYKGIVSVGEVSCHEIVLTNSINSDQTHYFLATKNLLMIQSIDKLPDVSITTSYDDFRLVNGLLVPFYSKSVYQPWQQEEEIWVTSYFIDTEMDDQLFSVPKSNRDYRMKNNKPSVSIPFEFHENLIYVPVTLQGDTKLWILDSGASMSVIDRNYAVSLGLDIQGTIKGYGFGDLFELGFVSIPEYQLGDIQFNSQKVYVADGLSKNSYEPAIYGILGYDFLSRFVVEIDYDKHIARFHLPETFSYEGPGETIDAPLKYRTFTLPVMINGNQTAHWSVDLGSHQTSLHYSYAKQKNFTFKKGVETVSQGISGVTFSRLTHFNCLEISSLKLENQLVSIPIHAGKGATALGEVAGNIGNTTLRNFHLFLNYPKQEIILEKGQAFNRKFSRDKSGILVGRSNEKHPMVSYLAQDSPAFSAGLRTGDILLEVNNILINDRAPTQPIRNILRGVAGQTVYIVVLRDGKEIELSFILQNLHEDEADACAATK
jgi:hypothetical protein